jgi:hypothetical protein
MTRFITHLPLIEQRDRAALEIRMIPEPQRTYVLELLAALGPTAKDFVIAGAQAIKFAVKNARGTKDVDFILNVIALRAEPLQLEPVLKRLGYTAIAGARNFQFEKAYPQLGGQHTPENFSHPSRPAVNRVLGRTDTNKQLCNYWTLSGR